MATIRDRRLYAPAHFGCSYEVMWPRGMKRYLSEQKWWGFTGYMDWFDASDLKNPRNNPRGHYLTPQAYWDRKLAHYRSAGELGFTLDLIITPNHVFSDQVRPGVAADESNPRYFGQLVCPSKPEGRAIIHNNCRAVRGPAGRGRGTGRVHLVPAGLRRMRVRGMRAVGPDVGRAGEGHQGSSLSANTSSGRSGGSA